MHKANLTRFGPITYTPTSGNSTESATFKAIDAPAQLILSSPGLDRAQVTVNASIEAM